MNRHRNMKPDYDRRSGGATRANILLAIQVVALAAQLALGFVAWGRLDGRLSAMENDVNILMQASLRHEK